LFTSKQTNSTLILHILQDGNGNCSSVNTAISDALTALDAFDEVFVTSTAANPSILGYQSCIWSVHFVSSIGNIASLEVQAYNPVSRGIGTFGQKSLANDDTVSISTLVEGQKDAIKYALELLPNVGTVTVNADDYFQSVRGECSWRVTFDTKAGNLEDMTVSVLDLKTNASSAYTSPATYENVQISVHEIIAGTSQPISGNFALTFRGDRTRYMPYDVDSRTLELSLEALATIADVVVSRSDADENGGYTWTVTFLSELGSLPLIEFDDMDLTGTVVSGSVSKLVEGVSPPFNSLDTENGLPLGAVVITNLQDLSVLLTGLDEGIPYYVRVAAINAVGQGQFAFSAIPYAIPQPQRPGMPVDTTISALNANSITVTFSSPLNNGGEEVTFYKVFNSLFLRCFLELTQSIVGRICDEKVY
jgi:hypothetical protein